MKKGFNAEVSRECRQWIKLIGQILVAFGFVKMLGDNTNTPNH